MGSTNVQKRFRDYGFKTGFLMPGEKNFITDVPGVKVGHVTKKTDSLCTGLTLIDPGVENLFRAKLPAAIAIGNGFGKLAGITQVQELGTLETPIVLTNTLAVGPALRGLVDLTIEQTPDIQPIETVNGIVGETNDGFLNTIHAPAIVTEDVTAAYRVRTDGVELGCIGAGTGTRAFGWKGGIGGASRIVQVGDQSFTLGVSVQTNFGGALTMLGVPVGRQLGKTDFDQFVPAGDGSCMIVLATNAPVSSRQLERLARRALLGLVRTGSVMAHGSGDYAVAFSTSRAGLEWTAHGPALGDSNLMPFFVAAVESVEESVYDALFCATTTEGRDGNKLEALNQQMVVSLLQQRGV